MKAETTQLHKIYIMYCFANKYYIDLDITFICHVYSVNNAVD